MKYNSDLAYKILLYLENTSISETNGEVIIEGYSQEEISYHIKKLSEDGLVEAKNASTFGKLKWKAIDLTSAGHKYLKENRNEKQTILKNSILTPSQVLWLEAIYAKKINGETVSEKALRIELSDRLPIDFNPFEFKGAFLRGTNITLLGIGLIDPESEIIKNANKVIQGVREILKNNPDIKEITAQEISEITGMKRNEVESVLKDLSFLGMFHSSSINDSNGLATIKIDDRIFNEYYQYQNIEQVIKSFIPINNIKEDSAISKNMQTEIDSRKVFVVHGRNLYLRDAMFTFLRSIGLDPIEWGEAIKTTSQGSPYVGEVLDKAFNTAQAIVVLMTPDDEARLLEPYRGKKEPIYETELTPQPRQNVLFEAGMAMGRNPKRTVLVEIGELRPISDIAGRHTVRLDNSFGKRQDLVDRLEEAGCAVNIKGKKDWHTAGDFEKSLETQNKQSPLDINKVKNSHFTSELRSRNLKIKKTFSDRERDEFEIEGFEFIAKFFENSLNELKNENSHIDIKFQRIDAQHFSATIYLNGSQANTCNVRLNTDRFLSHGITYAHGRSAYSDISDSLTITDDGYTLFFKPMKFYNESDGSHSLNKEGAAEHFWEKFISPLQQ